MDNCYSAWIHVLKAHFNVKISHFTLSDFHMSKFHRKIAHLDIKPQNIVLMSEFPNCEIKLCDLEVLENELFT